MRASSKKRELLSALLLLLCLGFCVWKLPYGAAATDEALYLSIPYRLWQGDRLLLHEWHVTQLAGLLLLPLLRVCLALTGSTVGVLLLFRQLYLVFHAGVTLYLYRCLRRVSEQGALWAALLFLVFCPFNIPALSYNSMGIDLLSVSLVTLAICRRKGREAVLAGLCFAGAVLCNPYYFLLYLLYLAAVIAAALRKSGRYACLAPRVFLLFSAAGALIALVVCVKLFAGADLSLLLQTLPAVVSGDTAEPPSRSLPGVLYGMWASFGKNRLFLPTLGLSAALCLCRVLDRSWRRHRPLYLALAALLGLSYGLWFRLYANLSLNYLMFAVNIPGFFAWYFSEDRHSPLFFFVYLPGVVCWFCSAMASNLGFINIASVSTINMLASAVLITEAALSLLRDRTAKKAAGAVLLLAVAAQLGMLIEFRAVNVYPLSPVSAATARVEHGALRGLRVTQEERDRLENAWSACESVRESEGGTVAYLTEIPGQYLDDGKPCGAYSPWFPSVSVSENLPRLRLYWSLFPERMPERIVLGMDDPRADSYLLQELAPEYEVSELSGGYRLLTRRE